MVAPTKTEDPRPKTIPFEPFHDVILLDPIPRGLTPGGVALPENADMGPQQARVVAVGPGWTTAMGQLVRVNVAPGDVIVLALAKEPHVLSFDGHNYLITTMRDLIGKMLVKRD